MYAYHKYFFSALSLVFSICLVDGQLCSIHFLVLSCHGMWKQSHHLYHPLYIHIIKKIHYFLKFHQLKNIEKYLFVSVFLIIPFDSFVEQWIQNNKECHINHQQRNYPNYNNNNHFYNSCISVFIFTVTSRTKFLFFSFQIWSDSWKDDTIAITNNNNNKKTSRKQENNVLFIVTIY